MFSIQFNNEPWVRAAAFDLRTAIFVNEQGIHPTQEFDEHDTDDTEYLVLFDKNKMPVGTSRYVQDDAVTLRIDRLCVDEKWRYKKVGSRLVLETEHRGRRNGCLISKVHAEKHAVPFYEKLGYSRTSDDFIEDGIICQKMEKELFSNVCQ
ncbi:GNAT family N-acetyltransferase [Vagococcus vulneris]|uniref:N-acetyltransferase domain-containing protein n=1 Tax=Vagococcus vulneris TaxID=1977869 RepID=A0A429ZX61_9ENTE|nr:GNAT family N-acetyltransferase [Vagococcus vulneris]RST98444.1 hypothetical protein CBF37_07990 [Vagococcus vulneris]